MGFGVWGSGTRISGLGFREDRGEAPVGERTGLADLMLASPKLSLSLSLSLSREVWHQTKPLCISDLRIDAQTKLTDLSQVDIASPSVLVYKEHRQGPASGHSTSGSCFKRPSRICIESNEK